jgi:acetolactate synthase-1/2/3 large subunit
MSDGELTSPAPRPNRTGGQILVDALRLQGVDRIYCVPGESYLPVLDALVDVPEIAVVSARHEGAAANMAEADGKLTGRPGICMVTRGPGATHASIGVHTAFQDSTPMILFIGQVARSAKDREGFQEVDFRAMFAPLAKWAAEIDDPARIPEYLARAFRIALSGRAGPVVLALPEDMLSEVIPAPTQAEAAVAAGASVRASDVQAVGELLASASRPLLVVGGRVGFTRRSGTNLADLQASPRAIIRNKQGFDNDSLREALETYSGPETRSPALPERPLCWLRRRPVHEAEALARARLSAVTGHIIDDIRLASQLRHGK